MERFVELYQTVYKDLYRLAFYYLGNQQDAEDAVQETALSAYEHFGRLRNEESFRPWIFKILVNCCRQCRRRRKTWERPVENPEGSCQAARSSKAEIEEMLNGLTEEERLIVMLTVFGGYKGREIARILNKNHSTIRSKYRRALKKLESGFHKEEMPG